MRQFGRGYEGWKQQFAGEARAKGISANTIQALMATNYAQSDHQRRPRPAELSSLARSIPRQARRRHHRRQAGGS